MRRGSARDAALMAYWQRPTRPTRTRSARLLTLEATAHANTSTARPIRPRSTLICGSSTSTTWIRPGHDRGACSTCSYDYQSNVAAYPAMARATCARYRPPTLLAVGHRATGTSRPPARDAYLRDLPDAELHLLDTGHFATATHSDEIADLIADFLPRVD